LLVVGLSMTQPLDLEALEAALEKASPGPWCQSVRGDCYGGLEGVVLTPGHSVVHFDDESNAAAIVALMNAAPALIAELRAAREVVRVAKIGALDIANSWLDSTLSAYDAATKGGG